jgi:O-antigen ligase
LAGARGLLLITLLAAPWAYGAVQVWAWATLTILAFTALLLWAIGNATKGTLRIVWTPLYIPAALFLGLGLAQYYGHRTLDPVGTREALIKFSTDLVFFFLAYQLTATASRKLCRHFGLVVTIYAFALALFAIFQFFSSHGLIYWTVKTESTVTFGPYVNHNHYAGLMEMLIPLAAAFAISESTCLVKGIVLAFLALVPAASLVLSGSRGGFLSLAVEILILTAVWTFYYRPHKLDRKHCLLAGISVAVGTLFLFWLVPRTVVRRLAMVANLPMRPEVTLGMRPLIAQGSLRLFLAYPFWGAGLGSFEVGYPQYSTCPTDLVVDHAHNDYVEVLAETGTLGGLFVLGGVGLFFPFAFQDLGKRLESSKGWLQFGAALGCCGLLAHSFSDFNLHIPANAVWFAVCLALSAFRGRALRNDRIM